MKKLIALLLTVSLALSPLGGALAETALQDLLGGFLDMLSSVSIGNGKTVSPEPSPLLIQTVADKTFSARMNGYGWGGDEDAYSFSFKFCEPAVFSAEEIEALKKGDTLVMGFESFTVAKLQKEDGQITVTPKESWLEVLTLRKTEDGAGYTAETGAGLLMLEVLSMDCVAGPEFVYRGAAGETLTAKELLNLLWSEAFDLSDEILEIGFDGAGMLLWAEGPAIPEAGAADGSGDSEGQYDPLSLWSQDSPVKAELIAYVEAVTDDWSEAYVAPADRVAVFDFDGTLYGERFPTYFDVCLFLHRALHDESYTAEDDVRAYAEGLEAALLNGEPEPDSPRSTAQMAAETFKGFTVDAYRAYIRDFMNTPVWGFENMTYGEGLFLPMEELVQYLAGHDFKVFISSGSERALVRELIEGTLDEWIPSERVIGSSFTLTASGQGDKAGRSYDYRPEDEVLLEGNLTVKNLKANKVFSIVDEIGKAPLLVFGNSSGDLAMAQYAVQHGGRAYMLLCDDLERDWGDAETAAAFAETCASCGYTTISMRDDFMTIYGEDMMKTEGENALPAASLAGTAEEKANPQALIERLVISCAAYSQRDEQALAALSAADPDLGEKWARILALWETPAAVNAELPEGLPDDDTLCLVALGFQLNPDGTMREELIQRLKVLLAAAEKYPRARIVCTGGGTAADDPTATEAGKMAEWLRENGVDPSRILAEDKSVTTAQNAVFTFDLLEEHWPQVTQIAIVSSDYHIATGTLLFGAEAILRNSPAAVVSNAAWHAPSGTLSSMFQAGALIELSGDVETAFAIYYETYDIHELPPLNGEEKE